MVLSGTSYFKMTIPHFTNQARIGLEEMETGLDLHLICGNELLG